MKFTLLTLLLLPLTSFCQYNFYYGNIHSHTEYSDGNKDSLTSGVSTPGASFAYAKGSYHFDFLGISEHNHFSSANNPGMLLPKYAQGLYQADTSNQNGTFIAMYGLEFGTISQGGHIVAYGPKGLIGWETISGSPNYNIYCPLNNFTTFWNIIDTIPNAFCTLAHPQAGDFGNLLGNTPYNVVADRVITGTAIRSGSANSTTTSYTDAPATLYESEYMLALSKGYHLGPTIDHDNHYTTFGRTNQGRTVVLASTLNRDSIVSAYKQRRFYASDDWNVQVNYSINGNFMGAIDTIYSEPTISASITDLDPSDPVSNIKIYYGVPGSNSLPTILTQINNSNSITYTHSFPIGSSYYYYLKITQADGDIIWTAPIWIYLSPIPFPLDITSFTAYNKSNQVLLNWSLENIDNVSEITLEHSSDGISFSSLVSYPLMHNTPFEEFNYTHSSPSFGLNYYRLSYEDVDGNIKYSYINHVMVAADNTSFSLYPIPASNTINLSYNSLESTKAFIKIYNQEGREVYYQNIILQPNSNKIDIDISNLGSGFYYFVLQKNDIRLVDTRFIKL